MMTAAKLRLAMAAMRQSETKVADLCHELGITRQTLYRYVSLKRELRPDGAKLLPKHGETLPHWYRMISTYLRLDETTRTLS